MVVDNFDRRSTQRFKIPLKLHIRVANSLKEEPFIEVELRNISESGICFASDVPFSILKRYEIDISLIDGGNVKAFVKIGWSLKDEQKMIYGATFSHIAQEFHDRMIDSLPHSSNGFSIDISDRRASNRRSTTFQLPLSLDHRKIERRAHGRLKQRQAFASRFLSEEIKRLLYRRVVVTGLGIVSPTGIGKDRFLKGLREGLSGIRPLTRFDAKNFSCQLAGEVQDFKPLEYIHPKKTNRMDLAVQMGMVSAVLALRDADLRLENENSRRIGVAMGSTMGGLGWSFVQDDIFESRGTEHMHPYTIGAASPNACSGEIAANLKIRGPCVTFSQGCTSAASAITFGYERIRSGDVDLMFVGGCDAPLLPSIYAAFSRSGVMAKSDGTNTAVPKPFQRIEKVLCWLKEQLF